MSVNHGVLGSSPRGGAKQERGHLDLFFHLNPLQFYLGEDFSGYNFLFLHHPLG